MSVFLRAINRADISLTRTAIKEKAQVEPKPLRQAEDRLEMEESFSKCSRLFHGTSSDRFPTPRIGDEIEVQNGLYTTHDETLARGYAGNSQPSAFRPDAWMHHIDGFASPETSVKALLLRFGTTSSTDCEKYVKGAVHTFPHGIKLKVLQVDED